MTAFGSCADKIADAGSGCPRTPAQAGKMAPLLAAGWRKYLIAGRKGLEGDPGKEKGWRSRGFAGPPVPGRHSHNQVVQVAGAQSQMGIMRGIELLRWPVARRLRSDGEEPGLEGMPGGKRLAPPRAAGLVAAATRFSARWSR